MKLRQSIYGEEHPVTKKTLDLFTVIYAEMGKEQYTGATQYSNHLLLALDKTKRSNPRKVTLPKLFFDQFFWRCLLSSDFGFGERNLFVLLMLSL